MFRSTIHCYSYSRGLHWHELVVAKYDLSRYDLNYDLGIVVGIIGRTYSLCAGYYPAR